MNTVIVISTPTLLKYSMLVSWVLNPPVAMVPKEWQRASNSDTFWTNNRIVSVVVRPMKISEKTQAARWVLAWALSWLGPGISVTIKALPAEPIPRIATNKTMIPNPPKKCVSDLQNKIARGIRS